MTETQLIEQILKPKLTREKYIELREKGRTKKQIAEQWELKNIHSSISCFGLSGWEPGQPIPERTVRKKPNKDTVRIQKDEHKDHLPEVTNMVEHPPHYTAGGIECIDAIMAAVTGLTPQEAVCVANVIKYTWRFKHKNGKQDLAKAEWYLQRLMGLQNGGS
jgi:hypothetical protein